MHVKAILDSLDVYIYVCTLHTCISFLRYIPSARAVGVPFAVSYMCTYDLAYLYLQSKPRAANSRAAKLPRHLRGYLYLQSSCLLKFMRYRVDKEVRYPRFFDMPHTALFH